MTEATDKPLRRIVDGGSHGLLVLEITRRTATLRPKGTRKGGRSEAAATWGQIYQRLLLGGRL